MENPIKVIELHFESLSFQDIAKFYGMKNMKDLK